MSGLGASAINRLGTGLMEVVRAIGGGGGGAVAGRGGSSVLWSGSEASTGMGGGTGGGEDSGTGEGENFSLYASMSRGLGTEEGTTGGARRGDTYRGFS